MSDTNNTTSQHMNDPNPICFQWCILGLDVEQVPMQLIVIINSNFCVIITINDVPGEYVVVVDNPAHIGNLDVLFGAPKVCRYDFF